MKDLHVLEWSKRQNAFHIQALVHTVTRNQMAFVDNRTHDFLVLFVGEKEACHQMADNWRNRLRERSKSIAA